MDQWLLAVTSDLAAKWSAKGGCKCWSGSLPFYPSPLLSLPCVVPNIVIYLIDLLLQEVGGHDHRYM